MDFNSLKDVMNKEKVLFNRLLTLFSAKKNILIKNDIENLVLVDKKIMATMEDIKNCPQRENFKTLIEKYPENKAELQIYQEEFQQLHKQITLLNQTNMELIKHGIVLANKQLETIVHICTPKTNSYNKYGTMQTTTMSSIVQEA